MKYIVANWKMNKTNAEAEEFFKEFLNLSHGGADGNRVIICPPFTTISLVAEAKDAWDIRAGAQNVHWADGGAHTGEISATMLSEFGVEYVLVGHSERRATGEDNEIVNKKIKAAIAAGLTPIFCIGEPLDVREEDATEKLLKWQIETGLRDVDVSKVITAYEPVWAIGTGRVATMDQIRQTHAFIKTLVDVPLLYGGSVTDGNAHEIMEIPNVDGVLVGGAALCPKKFAKICLS